MRFFWVWLKIFFSKNWLSELNLFFSNVTQKNWTFFSNVTPRIESFSLRLKELNPFFLIRLWELNPFFNTTLKLTQKIWLVILFFKDDSKNCFFEYDSTNWTFFFRMTPSTQLLFSKWLKKLEFYSKKNSKNWIFFFERYDPKQLNFFFQFRLKELNFFQYDTQNWTFFKNTTHRRWPKNWTLFSWVWRKELNPLFLEYDAMNWTVKFLEFDTKNWSFFLNVTQRIGPFSQIWRKEMN